MEFLFYSLAIDEIIDSTDAVQLFAFVRGIDDNINASEELAGKQFTRLDYWKRHLQHYYRLCY